MSSKEKVLQYVKYALEGVWSFGRQTIWATRCLGDRHLGDMLGDKSFGRQTFGRQFGRYHINLVCPFIPLATGDDKSLEQSLCRFVESLQLTCIGNAL